MYSQFPATPQILELYFEVYWHFHGNLSNVALPCLTQVAKNECSHFQRQPVILCYYFRLLNRALWCHISNRIQHRTRARLDYSEEFVFVFQVINNRLGYRQTLHVRFRFVHIFVKGLYRRYRNQNYQRRPFSQTTRKYMTKHYPSRDYRKPWYKFLIEQFIFGYHVIFLWAETRTRLYPSEYILIPKINCSITVTKTIHTNFF